MITTLQASPSAGGRGIEIPLMCEFFDSFPSVSTVCDAGGCEDGYPCIQGQYPAGERFSRIDIFDARLIIHDFVKWCNINTVTIDLTSKEFTERVGQYNAITCISVLEHAHSDIYGNKGGEGSDKRIVQNLVDKLVPGGELLVTVPATAEPVDCAWWLHSYGVDEVFSLAEVRGAGTSVNFYHADNKWLWGKHTVESFIKVATEQREGIGSIAAITYKKESQ